MFFSSAFPFRLQEDLKAVMSVIPVKLICNITAACSSQYVTYDMGEYSISYPYRVYFTEVSDEEIGRLDADQKLMLYCIYTRSSDGHLREKYLRKLLENNYSEWCIPYIIKLSDEYVAEIIDVIYKNLNKRENRDIRKFCLLNKEAVFKSCSRMISYWNEYYRSQWANLKQYPGYKLYRECFGVSMVKSKNKYTQN